VDFQQRRPQLRVFGFGLGAERLLGHWNPELLRDCPNRFRKGNVLDFLNKTEHVPGSLAAKAVVKLARSMHRERRRLLLMKRAQTGVVLRARFPQTDVSAHDADDVSLLLESLREVGGESHEY